MENMLIRQELKKTGLKQWQLAELMEVSEQTMYRKLRKELPEREQLRILDVIRKVKAV